MGEIKNCELCGDVFVTEDKTEKYCKKCRLSLEEDYKKMKTYLYKNSGATVMDIAAHTGVSPKSLLILMNESRFKRK